MSTTVATVPQGAIPAIGIPDSEDIPRLVYCAPYFQQVPLAELIEPSVQESVEGMLPTLLPPYVQDAANAAVQQQAVLLAGSTMTGALYLSPVLPTQPAQAASKSYVDLMISTAGVPEVPAVPAGQDWVRQTGQWVPLASAAGSYLPLTGGSMQGQINMSGNGILNLPAIPTLPNGAAPAQWVLNQIAAQSLYQGTWNADTNVPDLTQPAYHQNGFTFIVTTASTTGVVVSQPIPGIQGLTVYEGDNVVYSGLKGQFDLIRAGGITLAEANSLYVPYTGGQMSGPLLLNANATAAMGATTLQQVQALVGTGGIPEAPSDGQTYGRVGSSGGSWHLALPLAGGTMAGPITLQANAVSAMQAVPLQQVQSAVAAYVPLAGGVTMTGPLTMGAAGTLTLNGNASQPLQAVPFQQLTSTLASYMSLNGVVSSTPPGAPGAGQIWYNLNDGQTYIWTGTVWAVAVNPPVPDLSGYALLNGATFTGPLLGTSLALSSTLSVTGAATLAGGIVGVINGSNAAAGDVGEIVQSTVSPNFPLTTNAPVNATNITLTPGDWDVTGYVAYGISTGATTSYVAISTTSATLPTLPTINGAVVTHSSANSTLGSENIAAGIARINVTVSTAVFLVALVTFPGGTVTISTAALWARRVR